MALSVRPVTPEEWPAFEALFTGRGCPGWCWCTPYRFHGVDRADRDEKRQAMKDRIAADVPVGVLAFDGKEPVGWCSVAPRTTYARLDASRSMPKVEEEAWVVLCFFVRRDHRGQGIARALLQGAVRYAKANGAALVEGYPWDTAGVSSTHRGHSSLYAEAGFERDGATRRWVRRLRRQLA